MSEPTRMRKPKPLPLRPHFGCDPLCSECGDAMWGIDKAIEPLIDKALRAFWKVVRAEYPDILPEEFPEWLSCEVEDLQSTATTVVSVWLFEKWNEAHTSASRRLRSRPKAVALASAARPPILPAAESVDGGGGEENAASRVEGRCKFCGDCRLLDVNGHCLVCVNGMERTKGD